MVKKDLDKMVEELQYVLSEVLKGLEEIREESSNYNVKEKAKRLHSLMMFGPNKK